MWSWQADPSHATPDVPGFTCLLAQDWVPPSTTKVPYFISGCQFGTVCNNSLPHHDDPSASLGASNLRIPPSLSDECRKAHARHLDFAHNYTEFLVSLHNV